MQQDIPKDFEFYDDNDYIEALSISRKTSNDLEAQDWQPNLTIDIDFIIPFDGMAKDIQQWILKGQQRNQPGLSLLSTLAILSTAKGRNYSYQGDIKGNLMMIGLCESGDGKDHCKTIVQKALEKCSKGSYSIGNYVHSRMASGAALTDTIAEPPHTSCMLIDEVGHYLGGISGKKSSMYSAEIMPMVTELYTSASGLYIAKARKGEPGARIQHPNVTMLGVSSEKQFLDIVNDDMLLDGSLARFLLIFGEIDPPPLFNIEKDKMPVDIALELCDIFFRFRDQLNFEPEQLEVTQDYVDQFNFLQQYFYALALKCEDLRFKPFYKRLAVRTMQMAMLIDGCRSIDVLNWCAEINEKCLDIFIKKYQHNVAGNIYENWVKTVERSIKESGKKGLTRNELRVKCKTMPVDSREKIIKDLMDHELIFTDSLQYKGKLQLKYFWRK